MNAHYIFKIHTTTWNEGTEEKKSQKKENSLN